MDVVTPLVVLYLGALFIFSGLIVNLVQVFCFVAIRPFSKNLYRRINRVIVQLLWLQLIWLFDWWACVKLEIYADDQTFQAMGNENALVTPNHRGDMDWLVGWMLGQRSGCLGSTLAVMKKSSKFLPVIGWSMWFTEYLFLERNWTKDETTLKSGMQRLNDFPCPFWVAFFVEGTRFTEAKLLASQEFAASNGMAIPKNVLIPRTKGFVATVNNMREFVPAVYDVTVVVPKVSTPPTMLSMLQGKPSVVHAYLKRHSMNELPLSDEEIAQWCKERFIEKDALIEKHLDKGSFDEKDHRPTRRSVASFLVVFGWSFLFLASAVETVIRFSVFSTWKGIVSTGGFLVLVTATMHIFILFSRAERAGLPKATPRRQKAE